MAVELQPTPNPNTPIVDILTMENVQARADALKERHEYERQQLIRDPHAFSADDIPHLTDARLVALIAEGKITEKQYIDEMLARQQILYPYQKGEKIREELENNLPIVKLAYAHDQAINAALDRRQKGIPLTAEETKQLSALDSELKEQETSTQRFTSTLSTIIDSAKAGTLDQNELTTYIQTARSADLITLLREKAITQDQYDEEQTRRSALHQATLSLKPAAPSTGSGSLEAFVDAQTGVQILRRNFTPKQARDYVATLPLEHQRGLNVELDKLEASGLQYTVSVRRDGRGAYGLEQFIQQPPNPWNNVKKDAAQSVTREVRRETGKQINRLINPDYAHNEMIREYRLVREALPQGTATRRMLEKTDAAVSAVLTASGLTAEAANFLVNAIRGALLESPELKFKVAALIPDDLVRQSYVVGARSMGNTLREYIHRKYHLPEKPKQTPILVNTLGQLKPEQYRTQDAQKVGVDMRDLPREKAREFILTHVPTEKQASALETIDRLPGNTFGVQIMDTGWVRISASAREPRSYDNRPRYGSYDATPKPAAS